MVLVDSKQNKIMSMNQIVTILKEDKQKGFIIVQCHGVFDLIHPGHIRNHVQAFSRLSQGVSILILIDDCIAYDQDF